MRITPLVYYGTLYSETSHRIRDQEPERQVCRRTSREVLGLLRQPEAMFSLGTFDFGGDLTCAFTEDTFVSGSQPRRSVRPYY